MFYRLSLVHLLRFTNWIHNSNQCVGWQAHRQAGKQTHARIQFVIASSDQFRCFFCLQHSKSSFFISHFMLPLFFRSCLFSHTHRDEDEIKYKIPCCSSCHHFQMVSIRLFVFRVRIRRWGLLNCASAAIFTQSFAQCIFFIWTGSTLPVDTHIIQGVYQFAFIRHWTQDLWWLHVTWTEMK